MWMRKLYLVLSLSITQHLFGHVACQSYGNNSYSAVAAVNYVRHLPRLSPSLGKTSKDFNIDQSDLRNEYTSSLIVFPVLLVSLLFAAMSIWLFCWIKSRPKGDVDGDIKQHIQQNSILKRRQCQFFTFLILFILACHGLLFAMSFALDAADTSKTASDFLLNVSVELHTGGQDLDTAGDSSFSLVQMALPACPAAYRVMDYQPQYHSKVQAYLDLISPIPGKSKDFQDFLDEWGEKGVTQIVLVIYIISIIITLPILVSLLLKKSNLLFISVSMGFLVLLGLIVVWCLVLIGLVSLIHTCKRSDRYGAAHVCTMLLVY